MIPVRIWIESLIQHEPDIEPEVIRQEMTGTFRCRENDEWVIRYVEQEGQEDEVRTTVKSLPESMIVIRQGAVAYRQTYVPGRMTESLVHTPAGITEMEVSTLSCTRNRSGGEGEIRLSFLLGMGGEDLGRYELNLRWMEERQDESA
ncbi:DUF1934 domain-containing protein [Staphylospora marina]|uniref:DUF1934 domain-containing protein n=1 Tax=Staphylospora marina TaxID=2490858 RepID=UPI0013DE086D|nr:DUF1934 domain-containing protein [Staphylospora marina]